MKNLSKIYVIFSLLCCFSFISVNAQITTISQIKDVQPTDKHFMALQSLVERYGVFSDAKFRGNDPLTREEFVVLLNSSLDRLQELAASTDEEIFAFELFSSFSANQTNITSISQIKDIKATYNQYVHLESLIERYGIDICDADKNFRPTKTVTEKEFYTWIEKIFNGSANSNPSATKAITRSDWIIVMEAALESVNEKISTLVDEKKAQNQTKKQADLIKNLPAKGKAKIVAYLKSYTTNNTCIDFAGASDDLKKAAVNGGLWNGYKMKNDDIGDIIFETNNTCKKGEKLVLLRIGTAIVTMTPKGIKRLK